MPGYDELAQTGKTIGAQWPDLIQILRDLRPLHEMVRSGAYPDQRLRRLDLGDSAGNPNNLQIDAATANLIHFLVDGNTVLSLSDANLIAPGAIVAQAGLGVTGDLSVTGNAAIGGDLTGVAALIIDSLTVNGAAGINMNGGPISNVGALVATSLNGLDIAAHAARHGANGADPIPTGNVSDIGSANASGVSNSLSRADHTHRGIRSLDVDGGADLFGDIALVSGAGIDIGESGQTLTIAAQPVRGSVTRTGAGDFLTTATVQTIVQDNNNDELKVQLTTASFPRFTATKKVDISFGFTMQTTGADTDVVVRVHAGANGTIADPVVFETRYDNQAQGATNEAVPMGFAMIPDVDLDPDEYVLVSIQGSAVTLLGGTERQYLCVREAV